MLARLGAAVALTMAVMVFSLPLYSRDVYAAEVTERSDLAVHLPALLRATSLLLASTVFVLLGGPILLAAARAARRGVLAVDALIVIGVGATLVYSFLAVWRGTGHTYFETACMILVLVTLGRYLEASGRSRAADTIRALEKLLPDEVDVWRNERWVPIRRDCVHVDDVVHVAAGGTCPVDGRIVSGRAQVDQRIVTGESHPVQRQPGDDVFAGTIPVDGSLHVMVTRIGAASMLGRLKSVLDEARRAKGRLERLADRLAGAFVPLVVVLSLLTVGYGMSHGDTERAILNGLAVLLISCPCALGIATPLAVWMAHGAAAKRGAVFVHGAAVETLARIRTVAFDKTGTLTEPEPDVVAFSMNDADTESEPDLVAAAAGLAKASMHVLCQGIGRYAQTRCITPAAFIETKTVAGRGVVGQLNGCTYRLGSRTFLTDGLAGGVGGAGAWLDDRAPADAAVTILARDSHVAGLFTFRDHLRGDATAAIAEIRRLACNVRVLTGDHTARGREIAEQLGVDVRAGLSPQDKIRSLREFRDSAGPVAMIGDGLNDAPALAAADVGIAMGCGADLTRESADVCLLGNDLKVVPWLIRLSRRAMTIVRQNLFWAFAYNLVGIPLAITGRLSPIFAALAMVASSLLVLGNSLRLRGFDGVTRA
jgi:heavy metal translocating P-type ATPase